MEINIFNSLLLKTAFSCMACDGDIDSREVEMIKSLSNERKIFGEINIENELEKLVEQINDNGQQFLRSYLSEVSKTTLSEDEELKLIEVAVATINADDVIEYSEIKFFKIIKSKLKVSNNKIREHFPNIEEDYLEQDIISPAYLFRLQNDFFSGYSLPKFSPIKQISDEIMNKIKEK
jgi:uncharacterized tellurite resistance protein B-like protein